MSRELCSKSSKRCRLRSMICRSACMPHPAVQQRQEADKWCLHRTPCTQDILHHVMWNKHLQGPMPPACAVLSSVQAVDHQIVILCKHCAVGACAG